MSNHLKQAQVIISSAWQRGLTFRFTIATYRVGEIAEVLILVLMWTSIYSAGFGGIKGYSLPEMITYVLIGNLFSTAVRSFLPSYISVYINEGRLSMFLVKPIPFLKFVFLNELGRTSLVTVISLITQSAVILFFLDKFIFNFELPYLGIILIMLLFAFIIELLMGFLVGCISFWTEEIDGLHQSIERLKRFFSGGYFPISLLPTAAVVASTYLPFQYSFFIPAQLYLKKISLEQGYHGLLIQLVWIGILALLVHIVWKLGLKRYEAVGS